MADTHETIADIIAEIRAIANEKRRANDPREYEAAVSMNDYADRLEAAHKRECGDAAKLRDALLKSREFIVRLVCSWEECEGIGCGEEEILQTIDSALAAPATAENSSAVGDCAKLREALEALVDVIDKCDSGSPLWWHSGAKGVKPLKDARAALAATKQEGDNNG